MFSIANILTLIGIIVAALIFGFSRKFSRPSFVYDHNILQVKSHPDVVIKYKNKRIDNLSRSRILFFNSGTREIRSEDKPESRPPTISFTEGAKILSYNILKASSESIGFKVNQLNDTTLTLDFLYLNPKDGAVIEVLFDNPDRNFHIAFWAEFIGSRRVKRYRYDFSSKSIDIYSILGYVSGFGIPLFIINSIAMRHLPKMNVVILLTALVFFWYHFVRQLRVVLGYPIPQFARDVFESQ